MRAGAVLLRDHCLFGSYAIDSGPVAFSAERFANNSATDSFVPLGGCARALLFSPLDEVIPLLVSSSATYPIRRIFSSRSRLLKPKSLDRYSRILLTCR
jgi:hypothetical protein